MDLLVKLRTHFNYEELNIFLDWVGFCLENYTKVLAGNCNSCLLRHCFVTIFRGIGGKVAY